MIGLAGAATFLSLMRLVGGGIAVVVALLLIPAYRASRNSRDSELQKDVINIGFWGETMFQVLVILAYLLTAVGSFVTI